MIKIIDKIMEIFIILLGFLFLFNAPNIYYQLFIGGLLIWYVKGWLKDNG